MPWKFHDLNLPKFHVMIYHAEQIKPGQVTWNSHEIGCQFCMYITKKDVTLYTFDLCLHTLCFSWLFDGRLVENDTTSDGNPIIFLTNAMEIPWLELVQNPCHVSAWKLNKSWINDMELSWNFVLIWIKLPSICETGSVLFLLLLFIINIIDFS